MFIFQILTFFNILKHKSIISWAVLPYNYLYNEVFYFNDIDKSKYLNQKQNNTYCLSAYNEEVCIYYLIHTRAMKGGAIILTLWVTSDMKYANYTQGHRNGMSYSVFKCQVYLVLKL